MEAIEFDLAPGEDRHLVLTVYSEQITDPADLPPVQNVTGWTAALYVRRRYDLAIVLTVTLTVLSGVGGTLEGTIGANVTRLFEPGGYVADAWRTNTGAETQLCLGRVKLRPRVRAVA